MITKNVDDLTIDDAIKSAYDRWKLSSQYFLYSVLLN